MHPTRLTPSCRTSRHRHAIRGLLLFFLFLALGPITAVIAQEPTTPPPTTSDADTPAPNFDTAHSTPKENADEAWTTLTDAVTDRRHAQTRIQALAALGTLGANPRSSLLISKAMSDSDVDVRTAAILAAGQTKNRNLTTDVRSMLDDKEPQVAFIAASTLWKMNDRSGEDILVAVAHGDRSAYSGGFSGTMHTLNKDLHDPSGLARIGATQGAYMLLGPFGYGLTAYEYLHKSGGNLARATAIEQLAEDHTGPIRTELLSALTDKDPAVRATAAKALGEYHEPEVSAALANLFLDPKPPVRYTASAAYLRSITPATTPTPAPTRARKTTRKR